MMREGSVIYVVTDGRRAQDTVGGLVAPLMADVIPIDTPSALLEMPMRPGAGCIVFDIRAHKPPGSRELREIAQSHDRIPVLFVTVDDVGVQCMRPVLGGWETVEVPDHDDHLRRALVVSLAGDELAREGRRSSREASRRADTE
jgi:FixJ family two-component response regulator